jgi:hypothetical protein
MTTENKKIWYFECPHCQGMVEIPANDFACRIFRHGVYRANGLSIPPHLGKNECEELVKNNKVWGCAKPFQLIRQGTTPQQQEQCVACDYV